MQLYTTVSVTQMKPEQNNFFKVINEVCHHYYSH